jgi:hypothetical protein
MTRTRTILLSAAAAVSLGTAPVAYAEMPSSPAEMSQTRALNASAQSGTYTSPCALNGEKAQLRTDAQSSQGYGQSRNAQANVAHSDCPSRHARYSRTHHRTAATTDTRAYHATASDSGRVYGRMNDRVGTATTPGYSTHSSYAYGQSASGQTTYNQRVVSAGQVNNPYATKEYGETQYGQGDQFSEPSSQSDQRGRMAYGAVGEQQYAQSAPRNEDYGQGSANGRGSYGSYEQGSYARSNFNAEDFVSLKTVDPDRLVNVSVETASGAAIGRVTDVTLARDGTPSEIEIALNSGRQVRLSASTLRYNPNERILLTNLDARELQSMASGGEEYRE